MFAFTKIQANNRTSKDSHPYAASSRVHGGDGTPLANLGVIYFGCVEACSKNVNLLLELNPNLKYSVPVDPSNPPTAYSMSCRTAAPSVDLLASIVAPGVQQSVRGSYLSTVRTRSEPLKPPTAHMHPCHVKTRIKTRKKTIVTRYHFIQNIYNIVFQTQTTRFDISLQATFVGHSWLATIKVM